MNIASVCCVCVTYNAITEDVCEIYNSLNGQIADFIVVDNSLVTDSSFVETFPGKVIRLGRNLGIAAAQNIGISEALSLGYEFVLLTDQDTLYPPEYVNEMLIGFQFDSSVGVVVPDVFDEIKGVLQGFTRRSSKTFSRRRLDNAGTVLHANASGMLIKSDCFNKVGLMKEDFFIDWVDFEWCWRCLRENILIVALPQVIINHKLGDARRKLFFYDVSARNDQRYFYIIRNAVYIFIRNKTLNIGLKISLFFKIITYFFGYLVLSKNRLSTLSVLLKAIGFGLIGKLGRYDI